MTNGIGNGRCWWQVLLVGIVSLVAGAAGARRCWWKVLLEVVNVVTGVTRNSCC